MGRKCRGGFSARARRPNVMRSRLWNSRTIGRAWLFAFRIDVADSLVPPQFKNPVDIQEHYARKVRSFGTKAEAK
jgi:hypothetical protein